MTLTNTQKKIVAVLIIATSPIWITAVATVAVFAIPVITIKWFYDSICKNLGVTT